MFVPKNSKVALTLLCLVVALGLATVSEANSLVHSHRDHADLNRMIKKRSPAGGLLAPIIGAEGASASVSTASAASATSTDASSLTLTNTAINIPSASSAAASSATDTASSTNGGLLSLPLFGSSTSSAASSTSSSQASSSTSSSSTVSSTSSTSVASTPTQNPATDTPSSTFTSTTYVTASDSSSPSGTAGASTTGASSANDGKITRTTLTVIIVIAATVGFIALAWTLFRKWKLRPSSNFDDRMQPIDWQPSGPDDSGLPNHRRANSAASHGSFHSSSHAHGGMDPLPEHDFTAGALAPVGGYADLHRGPSPQPMAQLHRGPSATRADYNAYDYNGMRY